MTEEEERAPNQRVRKDGEEIDSVNESNEVYPTIL
jgi:hypothetical protein